MLASQIDRFIFSLLQIVLFYMNICFEREKQEKEKQTWLLKKLTTDLFDKFLTMYKQTHVSVNRQQTKRECSRLEHEIKKGKENAATKSEAQNPMLQ